MHGLVRWDLEKSSDLVCSDWLFLRKFCLYENLEVQFLFLLCLLRSYDGTDISNFVKLNDFTFPQKLYSVEIVYLLLTFLLKQFID